MNLPTSVATADIWQKFPHRHRNDRTHCFNYVGFMRSKRNRDIELSAKSAQSAACYSILINLNEKVFRRREIQAQSLPIFSSLAFAFTLPFIPVHSELYRLTSCWVGLVLRTSAQTKYSKCSWYSAERIRSCSSTLGISCGISAIAVLYDNTAAKVFTLCLTCMWNVIISIWVAVIALFSLASC